AQCAEFIIGPAKSRAPGVISPYGLRGGGSTRYRPPFCCGNLALRGACAGLGDRADRATVHPCDHEGRVCMKYALMISATLLVALGQGQPASAQSPTDLVKQAVDALGGADALRAVKTLVTKADAKHWEPGQSNSVNGESRFLGDSTVTITVDFAAQ